MNDCRNIEPLLYLYRDGELSAAEHTTVLEHLKTCPACSAVLRELQSMDASLAPLRSEAPAFTEDPSLVNETLAIIAGTTKKAPSRRKADSSVDSIIRWLQPALGFGLAAAILLFVVQQSRDAMKIAGLENSLRANGTSAMAGESFTNSVAQRLLDLAAEQKNGGRLLSSMQSATAVSDPSRAITAGILSLLRHDSGVFDEFARRYPELATVTLEDGIDEREQKILDTEGRAFLSDFEKLLRKGK